MLNHHSHLRAERGIIPVTVEAHDSSALSTVASSPSSPNVKGTPQVAFRGAVSQEASTPVEEGMFPYWFPLNLQLVLRSFRRLPKRKNSKKKYGAHSKEPKSSPKDHDERFELLRKEDETYVKHSAEEMQIIVSPQIIWLMLTLAR